MGKHDWNNRELAIRAITHQEVDRTPYQLDLTHDISLRLAKELGADFEKEAHGCIAVERNESFTAVDPRRDRDMFGVVWCKDQEGDFGTVDGLVLPEADFGDYQFPEPDEKLIREKCERLTSKENEDKFKMYIIGFSLFERAWALHGMENVLMDFILEPDFMHELLDRICDYNMKVAAIAMEYPIDAIFYGDDWGQQKGLIMGPDYWRTFLKPRLQKMYRQAKDRGLFVCQHSCGDVYEVFPDLVELGLDMYNTFQPEIYDVARAKKEFGDKLCFYGGISTQHILPHGTPEQVYQETKQMMETLKGNGGYICAPTHSMPNDIPTENVLAFLKAVQDQ